MKLKVSLDVSQLIANANRATAAMKAVSAASKDTGDATDKAGRSGIASMDGFSAAAGVAALGLARLVELAQGLAQATKDATDRQKEYAKGLAGQRDQLGELAALQGKPLDNQFTAAFDRFKVRTAMRTAEALAFQTEFYNSGAQFIGKNISQAEADQLQEQVGALAVARHLDPRTVGDLAGNLLGFKDFQGQYGDQASEQVLGQVVKVMQGLQRGRGDTGTLLKNATSLMAQTLSEDTLRGTFQSPEDVAALISTMAESKPEEAEVFGRAAIRALRDFRGKDMGPLLAKAGVTPQMAFAESAERVGGVITAESRAEGVPIQDIIGRYAPDEREKIALATLINKGIGPGGAIADRRAYMAQFGPESALADVAAYQGGEAGLLRVREAQTEREMNARGAETSKIQILRQEALAMLIRDKAINMTATNFADLMAGKLSFGTLGDVQQQRIDATVEALLSRRTKGGAALMDRLPLNLTTEGREAVFNRQIADIERQGGNALQDALDRNTAAMQANTAAMQGQGQGNPGVPPALPVGGAGGPWRNGPQP